MNGFLAKIHKDVSECRRISIFSLPDRRSKLFASAEAAEEYALSLPPKKDVYHCLSLIKGKPTGRGKKEHCVSVSSVWCDIDVAGEAHGTENKPATKDEAVAFLDSLPVAPSIIVDSGHGIHGYWPLFEPLSFATAAERDSAEKFTKGWHGMVCAEAKKRGWKLENLGDLPRVLRVPGTWNNKAIGDARKVTVLRSTDKVFSLIELRSYLSPAQSAKPKAANGTAIDLNAAMTRCLRYLDMIPAAIQGQAGGTQTLMACKAIFRFGLDGAEARKAFDYYNQKCQPRWEKDKEIEHKLTDGKASVEKDGELGLWLTKESEWQYNGKDVDLTRLLGTMQKPQTVAPTAQTTRHGIEIGEPNLLYLGDVEPEEVRWLWPGKIPLGKLTLVSGDPGLGKSLLSIDIAARITTGSPWPCDPGSVRDPSDVLMICCEDDPSDTIRPRADVAGADSEKIAILQSVSWFNTETKQPTEKRFSLQSDLESLKRALDRMPECRLVVVDPISAYLGEVDSHKNAEVRSVLDPLALLASERSVAVVGVNHLNKGGGAALYRSIGSIAFVAAVRSAWAVTRDKENPTRRLMLPLKCNLAKDTTGLAYQVVSRDNSPPWLEWEKEPITQTADEAMSQDDQRRGDNYAINEAVKWLREVLAEGGQPVDEIKRVSRSDGIAWRTLERAKAILKIRSEKSGFQSKSIWHMPEETQNAPFTEFEGYRQ